MSKLHNSIISCHKQNKNPESFSQFFAQAGCAPGWHTQGQPRNLCGLQESGRQPPLYSVPMRAQMVALTVMQAFHLLCWKKGPGNRALALGRWSEPRWEAGAAGSQREGRTLRGTQGSISPYSSSGSVSGKTFKHQENSTFPEESCESQFVGMG